MNKQGINRGWLNWSYHKLRNIVGKYKNEKQQGPIIYQMLFNGTPWQHRLGRTRKVNKVSKWRKLKKHIFDRDFNCPDIDRSYLDNYQCIEKSKKHLKISNNTQSLTFPKVMELSGRTNQGKQSMRLNLYNEPITNTTGFSGHVIAITDIESKPNYQKITPSKMCLYIGSKQIELK